MQIYALHDYDKGLKKRGCFPITQKEAVELNEQGYGIFFTPNTFDGPRVEKNLARLNMWFVDIDKGDKYSMENKIVNFELEPSLLIETKSGYHAYWKCEPMLFEDGLVGEYIDVLSRLVKYFDADTNAMGVNRVLRVPNFYHMKDRQNKFLITEVYRSEKFYALEEMIAALPEEEVVEKGEDEKKVQFFKSVPQDDFWRKVFELDCEKYLPMLSGAPECNGDEFRVEQYGSKAKIFTNGELVESCWVDHDGKIGSHSNGGPSIANWIKWYGHDWDIVAKCLKRCIPELDETIKLPESFTW